MNYVSVVFFDKKNKVYSIYTNQTSEKWHKRKKEILSDRYDLKVFAGDLQAKNVRSFEKYLSANGYKEQKIPFCF